MACGGDDPESISPGAPSPSGSSLPAEMTPIVANGGSAAAAPAASSAHVDESVYVGREVAAFEASDSAGIAGISVSSKDEALGVEWTEVSADHASIRVRAVSLSHRGGATVEASDTSATIGNLVNGISYAVAVEALSGVGKVVASGWSSGTPRAGSSGASGAGRAADTDDEGEEEEPAVEQPPSDPHPPPASVSPPTEQVAGVSVAGEDRSLRVRWAALSGNTHTRFVVRASSMSLDRRVEAGASETEAVVPGLNNGSTYAVTVAAANSAGEGPRSTAVAGQPRAGGSAPATATRPALVAVSVTATSNSYNTLTLRWPGVPGADAYDVALGRWGAPWTHGDGTQATSFKQPLRAETSRGHVFRGLASGSYLVRVRATRAGSTGPWSGPFSGVLHPGKPNSPYVLVRDRPTPSPSPPPPSSRGCAAGESAPCIDRDFARRTATQVWLRVYLRPGVTGSSHTGSSHTGTYHTGTYHTGTYHTGTYHTWANVPGARVAPASGTALPNTLPGFPVRKNSHGEYIEVGPIPRHASQNRRWQIQCRADAYAGNERRWTACGRSFATVPSRNN